MAVSYTHLELTQSEQARLTVSARITRLNAERNVILWAGLASGFAGNATPVSYTHLDVYKRQIQEQCG